MYHNVRDIQGLKPISVRPMSLLRRKISASKSPSRYQHLPFSHLLHHPHLTMSSIAPSQHIKRQHFISPLALTMLPLLLLNLLTLITPNPAPRHHQWHGRHREGLGELLIPFGPSHYSHRSAWSPWSPFALSCLQSQDTMPRGGRQDLIPKGKYIRKDNAPRRYS